MASEIWSAILSGWPSVTDSEVNRKRSLKAQFLPEVLYLGVGAGGIPGRSNSLAQITRRHRGSHSAREGVAPNTASLYGNCPIADGAKASLLNGEHYEFRRCRGGVNGKSEAQQPKASVRQGAGDRLAPRNHRWPPAGAIAEVADGEKYRNAHRHE